MKRVIPIPKEHIPPHHKQKLIWVIFNGRRKLCPVPYVYEMPDLKLLKQQSGVKYFSKDDGLIK